MENNIYHIFNSVTKKHSLNEISKNMNLHIGTLKRWILLKKVPSCYYFDLCKLNGIKIDYSKFTEKEKDQFYTTDNTAKYCVEKTFKVLKDYNVNLSDYNFIEPSCGDGSFLKNLPENKRTGIDIEPKIKEGIKTDFLSWFPNTNNNIVIGNPPFGLRGNLALKFVNHSSKFSDFVCFILPQLFNSEGKGSCKKRVSKELSLIHTEIIEPNFVYPNGKEVNVNVVFQIWSKLHKVKREVDNLSDIKIYSLSDGGTPGSTRNKKYLYSCDYYLPSTCFGKDQMKLYNSFEKLPHRRGYGIVVLSNKLKISDIIKKINWVKSCFTSTNGAYNLRVDLINKSIKKLY